MNAPLRCLLLPGMDGTGALLGDFAAALAPEFRTEIVVYPPDATWGYDELTQYASEHLPRNEPYLLVGESFSGPIAIRLAASRPAGLRGLVLCASFARAPRPPGWPLPTAWLARIGAALPIDRIPTTLTMRTMLGPGAGEHWQARMRAVLTQLDPAVIRTRMREGGNADESAALARIACPLLVLHGRRDRLVSRASARHIRAVQPQAQHVELDGPHCLLQLNAAQAADAIKRAFPQ